MKLQCLLLCCVLGATFRLSVSQRSFKCTNLTATNLLPADHICRTRFPQNTMIMVPNPMQTLYERRSYDPARDNGRLITESNRHFNDYMPVFTSNCSEKILFLVCLYHFPICIDSPFPGKEMPIFPCLEECEELTAPDSECGRILRTNNRIVSNASPFLGCNASYFNADDTTSGRSEPVYISEKEQVSSRRLCTPYSEPQKPEPAVTTTEAPCLDFNSELPENEDPTNKCRNRKNKLFHDLRRLHSLKLTYLINCTVTEVLLEGKGVFLKRAIKCRTNQFYSVSSKSICSNSSLSVETEVHILGYPTNCDLTTIPDTFDQSSVGKTYIIAGTEQITHCKQKFLYLTHRSIVFEDEGVTISTSSSCPSN